MFDIYTVYNYTTYIHYKIIYSGKTLMKSRLKLELAAAKRMWPEAVHTSVFEQLDLFVTRFGLSVNRGDLQILNGHWYVTHTGLLGLAHRRHCCGLHTEAIRSFCDPTTSRWAFKAIVYKSPTCKGFVGYGDADPSNVAVLVRGSEMRVAETRAVNRALRKAYGIGICSIEEIGSDAQSAEPRRNAKKLPSKSVNGNGWKAEPRLRDRLCQLIRQHELDPVLVKSYAVDFCGTKTLKEASREQVENFVVHLADWATKDKNALLCQLNSYVRAEGAA